MHQAELEECVLPSYAESEVRDALSQAVGGSSSRLLVGRVCLLPANACSVSCAPPVALQRPCGALVNCNDDLEGAGEPAQIFVW